MNILHINGAVVVYSYLIIMTVLPSIHSSESDIKDSLKYKLQPDVYKRVAKYCHINDYSAWLQRQHELMIWFELATILKLPIHEDKAFQREFQLYHLQYECLRAVERLPVSFGPG